MDEIDQAQRREAAYIAEQLDRQRSSAALDAPGNELCADCGEPIPEQRRRALPSAIRCVDCQAFAERVARASS